MKMFHAKANNVYIFTRKVRVSWLTKNHSGHLFHIHVNCLFFFVCFWVFFWTDFFKALIYKTIISEILWKDSSSAMLWTKQVAGQLICSQLSMNFFWKIVSDIFETIKIIVFLLYLNAFLWPSVINFNTEDIYSLSGLWWSKVYLALKWW